MPFTEDCINLVRGDDYVEEKDIIPCAYKNCPGEMTSQIKTWQKDDDIMSQRVWTCSKCNGNIYGGIIMQAKFIKP